MRDFSDDNKTNLYKCVGSLISAYSRSMGFRDGIITCKTEIVDGSLEISILWGRITKSGDLLPSRDNSRMSVIAITKKDIVTKHPGHILTDLGHEIEHRLCLIRDWALNGVNCEAKC